MSERRVLLVEDDERIRKLGQKLLEHHGYRVTVASDGAQGVEYALGAEFDIVLMDLSLPEIDGLEATRQIKALRPQLPIVAVTAHALDHDRQLAMSAGCDGFLTKPYTSALLIAEIEAQL